MIGMDCVPPFLTGDIHSFPEDLSIFPSGATMNDLIVNVFPVLASGSAFALSVTLFSAI